MHFVCFKEVKEEVIEGVKLTLFNENFSILRISQFREFFC